MVPGKERVVPVFLPNEEKRSRPTIQLTPDCNQITKGKEKHKRKNAEQSWYRVAEVGARKCRAYHWWGLSVVVNLLVVVIGGWVGVGRDEDVCSQWKEKRRHQPAVCRPLSPSSTFHDQLYKDFDWIFSVLHFCNLRKAWKHSFNTVNPSDQWFVILPFHTNKNVSIFSINKWSLKLEILPSSFLYSSISSPALPSGLV